MLELVVSRLLFFVSEVVLKLKFLSYAECAFSVHIKDTILRRAAQCPCCNTTPNGAMSRWKRHYFASPSVRMRNNILVMMTDRPVLPLPQRVQQVQRHIHSNHKRPVQNVPASIDRLLTNEEALEL
ncbi:hypothetical protein niasHT_037498 [Heterodera trifolii]|uniref:Secreted protein n=1 Tax=Heterodera trifolii TaxID=157864 RepID=A0ABD2IUR9_9BILA